MEMYTPSVNKANSDHVDNNHIFINKDRTLGEVQNLTKIDKQ